METNKQTIHPGINPLVNLDVLSIEEKKIVKKLAKKYWHVTRIESHETTSSCYRVVFLKPVDYITQNFNLVREIVLILSPYNTFEPRTLDVLDQLNIQGLRIEEVCCMVASKDPNIEKVLNDFMKSNTESRVVIPFTYNDLNNTSDDEFVVNQMRKFFYSRDLFGIQDPLKKELYFFGRRDLIHELVNKHINNENSGIFGLRKTGKTSIIYGVMRTLDRKDSHALLVDCQTLHLRPWNQALHTIIQNLIKGLQLKQTNFKQRQHLYDNVCEVASAFTTDLKTILQLSKKNILLIFDEIENITFGTSISESWKCGDSFVKFWQIIRSFCQHNDTKYHFSYLIAGTNPRCVETPTINKVDNPIFAQFTPIYISPFTFTLAEEMLHRLGGYMGLKFESQTVSAIVDDFGGHPMLIRQMASFIHRNVSLGRPITIKKADYMEFKQKFYTSETGFSQYAVMILNVLKDWYEDEYYMLQLLAKEDIDSFKELAAEDIYIKHLKSYGIIDTDNTRIGYHFRIEALKNYLHGRHKFHKTANSQEEKEAEIQKRRSQIELKLRKLVRRQLKSTLGEEEAKKAIIRILYGAKNIGHYLNQSYPMLFDASKHKIYLKTLFDVITQNYNVFKNLFDVPKEEFQSKSQLMNTYRRTDAHSIEISEDDFTTFQGIAGWFEKVLSEE